MAKGGAKILFGLFFFVVLVAGLAGGGAWYLTENREEGYRATTLLLLDPGELPAGALENADSLRDQAQSALGLAPAPGLAPPDYAILFESDEMAQAVLESLTAAGEGESAPEGLTLEGVKKAMKAEANIALQTAQNVVYQQVIQLHYTARDPALAAKGADAWAAECQKFALGLSQRGHAGPVDRVEEELAKARAELEQARNEQDALRNDEPLEPLELAATAAAESIEELRRAAREAEAEAAREEASLKALKGYVSKAPPAVVLELSMAEANAEAETAGARAESEYFKSQHAAAEQAAAQARTQWVAASRSHEKVEERIDRIMPRVRALERQLNAAERPGVSIEIAARAVPPETPIGPHRYAIVAGAAILGAIAGMIVYFGLLTLRVYARELDRS